MGHPIRRLGWVVAVLGLVAGMESRSSAGIIYDNLAMAPGNIHQVANRPIAVSFKTGAEASVLTDVMLKLTRFGAGGGSITVSLLSDSGLKPGGVLATIGTLADSAVAATGFIPMDYRVRVDTSFQLAASTRYWIQLRSDNGSQIAWSQAQYAGGVGTNGEYAAFPRNGNGAAAVTPNSAFHFPTQMRLTVGAAPLSPSPLAIVPEPSSLALCLAGAATGLVPAARRLRRRASATA